MAKNEFIGVSLSGGGHRATVFGLGCLLALVDLGLNRRVTQITSVSGGSITNAFVALRCRYEEATPETFDPIARELAATVVKRGVLTKKWITGFIAAAAAAPIAVAALLQLGALPMPAATVAALLAFWATLVLLRGLMVERFLAIRYFSSAKRVRLQDLQAQAVEHVICCTELTASKPFYVSSWSNGRVFLRVVDNPGLIKGGLWEAPNLPLDVAVRASAGFPGIPPRRVSLNRFRRVPETQLTFGGTVEPSAPPRAPTVFLSDGGVWNNLGTQVRLEDDFFRGQGRGTYPEVGVGSTGRPSVLFVVNASGQLKHQRPAQFYVPGWAELKALVRIVTIQNVNTVMPRIESLERARERSWLDDRAATAKAPLTIHVALSKSPCKLVSDWYHAFITRPVELSSMAKFRWATDLVDDLDNLLGFDHAEGQSGKIIERLSAALYRRPPPRIDEERRRIEDLRGWSGFETLCDLAEGDLAAEPTTLDRIPQDTAMRLLARGYVNTLAGAYIFGLVDYQRNMLSLLTKDRLQRLTS